MLTACHTFEKKYGIKKNFVRPFFSAVLETALVLRNFFGLNYSSEIQNCCTGAVLEYRIVALDLFIFKISVLEHKAFYCTAFFFILTYIQHLFP